LGIIRAALRRPGLLFGFAWPRFHQVYNARLDSLPYSEDFRDTALVVFTPKLRSSMRVDHFRLQVQDVITLAQSTGDNCLHLKFTADLLRLYSFSFVCKGCGPRDDSYIQRSRERIDHAFVNAVA